MNNAILVVDIQPLYKENFTFIYLLKVLSYIVKNKIFRNYEIYGIYDNVDKRELKLINLLYNKIFYKSFNAMEVNNKICKYKDDLYSFNTYLAMNKKECNEVSLIKYMLMVNKKSLKIKQGCFYLLSPTEGKHYISYIPSDLNDFILSLKLNRNQIQVNIIGGCEDKCVKQLSRILDVNNISHQVISSLCYSESRQ